MATLYYDNDTGDYDWATLGNWRLDNFTGTRVPATSLPTSSDDVVVAADVWTNAGSAPTVANLTVLGGNFAISSQTITVPGVAYFGPASSMECGVAGGEVIADGCNSYGQNGALTITGHLTVNGGTVIQQFIGCDAVFNDTSSFGDYLMGNGTFNHNSRSGTYMSVNYDATFNDSSYCDGPVDGDATFNDSSYCTANGVIAGTETYANRTPYPIPRGINGSSILGVI
jgi:phage baseplate assembly protein gpV